MEPYPMPQGAEYLGPVKGLVPFDLMGALKTPLEGNWEARRAISGGKSVPEVIGRRLSFFGDRFRIFHGSKPLYGGHFRLYTVAEVPSIIFEQSEGDALSGTWRGTYMVDFNRLSICDNAPDMSLPRPWSISDCAISGYIAIDFVRML